LGKELYTRKHYVSVLTAILKMPFRIMQKYEILRDNSVRTVVLTTTKHPCGKSKQT
jgi:hypothetical protein